MHEDVRDLVLLVDDDFSVRKMHTKVLSRVVCEGVETSAERDTLDRLGSDMQQGYLFGRPSAGFISPSWSDAVSA